MAAAIPKASRHLVSAWLGALAFAIVLPHPALAQAPPTPPAAAAAQDPAFEASKQAYDALPQADRLAIQGALVWTGDYNGTVDGNFGRGTRNAIIAFAQRSHLAVDGTLDPKGRAALVAAANQIEQGWRFAQVSDSVSGLSIGLPLKLLTKTTKGKTGTQYASADGSVNVTTQSSAPADGDLPAFFGKLNAASPGRRVTYKVLRPDFLVVSGDAAGRTFYTRIASGSIDNQPILRGFTLMLPTGLKDFGPVAIAIANSFAAFPAPAAVAALQKTLAPSTPVPQPPARPVVPALPGPQLTATALAIAADRVVTSLGDQACADPRVGSHKAKLVQQDAATGLALFEVDGLGASPRSLTPADLSAGQSVLVFFDGLKSPDAGAALADLAAPPPAELIAAGGNVTAPIGSNAAARVFAPLQVPAAGAVIFARDGTIAGLVAASKEAPKLVAGIVPATTYAVVPASILAKLAPDMARTPVPPAALTTADIAAAAQAILSPLYCSR